MVAEKMVAKETTTEEIEADVITVDSMILRQEW